MHRHTLRATTAVAALSLVAALAACSTSGSEEPTSLRIGIEPGLFSGQYDPVTAFGIDKSAVYEGLLFYDIQRSEYLPGLAEEFELSDDRTTAEFVLRENVDFTDGEHLDAETAAEVLTALMSNLVEASAWPYPDYDVHFRATDEYLLEVTTAIPMAPRLGSAFDSVVGLAIFSPLYLDDFAPLGTAPVGTGPYVLDEVVPEVSATFTRNPDYWDDDAALFDGLEVIVFEDKIAGLNALKSGQVDVVPISSSAAADAEVNGFRIHEGFIDTTGLWLADRGGSIQPALADVRVRRAIQLAFDRDVINESVNHGYGAITSQPFVPGTPEYVEGGDDRYGYDPEGARSLMADAGYSAGFDITIPITPFLGADAWEPIVTQYLGDIGIRVTYETFPDIGSYFTAAMSGTYPVLLCGTGGQTVLDVLFLPTAVLAFHAYSDPTLDELAARVTEGTLDETVEAASQIGEYVLDEAWFAVVSAPNVLWASNPEVEIVDGLEHLARVAQFRVAG